ncbi:hypothetical protein M0R72_08275 [Candidatus Pacearchaeota archaeon]|jgi:hypothetical protein|nr:hypothetical protein [Candidatus Pacearchaeota archaeon]
MTDDLIEKAIILANIDRTGGHYANRYLDIGRIVADLVAEIKRLRAMNPFQVAVPVAIRITDNLFAYGNAEESAKLQRLLMQLAAKDAIISDELARRKALGALNEDLMANCNQLRDRCWKAESELARWQQIAIDERAAKIQEANSGDFVDAQGNYIFQVMDIEKCRELAARELNLQVTQKAGYVERLEKEYLEIYKWINPDISEERARAALTKIREGK